MRWFKNLKKWQKGGLIGCAVGIILAILVILNYNYRNSLGEWIENFHELCYILPTFISFRWDETSIQRVIIDHGGAAAIVIFYGLLGMLAGRVQQIANPSQKWLLTALLALFLLGFYVISYYS